MQEVAISVVSENPETLIVEVEYMSEFKEVLQQHYGDHLAANALLDLRSKKIPGVDSFTKIIKKVKQSINPNKGEYDAYFLFNDDGEWLFAERGGRFTRLK